MTDVQAHTRYYDLSGELLPGVTTVIGQLDKPALVNWANREGLKGNDTTKMRGAAARAGTLAHLRIQQYLTTGEEPSLDEYSPMEVRESQPALDHFKLWQANHKFEVIASEKPLVSEIWKYGGTFDFLAVIDGVVTLVDWKTGATEVYREALFQIAALRELCRENKALLSGVTVQACRVLALSRTAGEGYGERILVDTVAHFAGFTHLLAFYRIQKYINGESKKRPARTDPDATRQAKVDVRPPNIVDFPSLTAPAAGSEKEETRKDDATSTT